MSAIKVKSNVSGLKLLELQLRQFSVLDLQAAAGGLRMAEVAAVLWRQL